MAQLPANESMGNVSLQWNRALANTEDVVMRILDNKLVSYVNGDDNLHGGVQGEPWPITAAWEGKPSEVLPPPLPDPVQATPLVVEPIAQPATCSFFICFKRCRFAFQQ